MDAPLTGIKVQCSLCPGQTEQVRKCVVKVKVDAFQK